MGLTTAAWLLCAISSIFFIAHCDERFIDPADGTLLDEETRLHAHHGHDHDHGHREDHGDGHHSHDHGGQQCTHDHVHDHDHEHDECDHEHEYHSHFKIQVIPPLSALLQEEEEEHVHAQSHAHAHDHSDHSHGRAAASKTGWDTALKSDAIYPVTAILLTCMSGMSAMIGGVAVTLGGAPSPSLLGHLLSFAAGIMLYISYADLLPHAMMAMDGAGGGEEGHSHGHDHGQGHGHSHGPGFYEANVWLFAGMLAFTAIVAGVNQLDKAVSVDGAHSHSHGQGSEAEDVQSHAPASGPAELALKASSSASPTRLSPQRLWMTGIVAAIGITAHNLPEGLIVYNQTIRGVCAGAARAEGEQSRLPAWILPVADALGLPADPSTCMSRGVAVTAAIALHNIPEGMAVAMPIYASTGSRWEAFKWTLVSSAAEPLAAVVFGYWLYGGSLTPHVMAALNAGVAGIMIALCLVELMPAAVEATSPLAAAVSNIAGQVVMFLSLHAMRSAGVH